MDIAEMLKYGSRKFGGQNKSGPETLSGNTTYKTAQRERVTGLGQVVLQGYSRQVQGSNGSNAAQPDRPWGSTQTVPTGHNRVKYPCLVGRVTGTEPRGRAHMPTVVSREGMTRLPNEKGPFNQRMPVTGTRRNSSDHARREQAPPQQLEYKEWKDDAAHSNLKNPKRDDADCQSQQPHNSQGWKGAAYSNENPTTVRASPL